MANKKTKAKKPVKAARVAKAAPAAGAFTVGQRVTVTAPGSFAARQCGKVTRANAGAGQVGVMLDHKLAEKLFPAGDLAAA